MNMSADPPLPRLDQVWPPPHPVEPRSWQGTTLRRQNYAAVLRTVLTDGPISRVDIARRVGLTPTAITNIVASLLRAGLVREVEPPSLGRDRGRPKVPVGIDPAGLTVLGIFIGGTQTSIGLIDLAGQLIAETDIEQTSESADELIEQTAAAARELITAVPLPTPVLGVGVSIGGWVDTERGTVRDHVHQHWIGAPLRDRLAERIGLPVVLNSNARAMALLESWLGAAKGVRDFIYVSIGALVGAALVIDGKVYDGAGSASGNIDHLSVRVRAQERCFCGRRDCLHVMVSDDATLRLAHQAGVDPSVASVRALAEVARAGDAAAQRVLRNRARHTGTAVGQLADLLNPELILLGGSILDAPEYLDDVRRRAAAGAHAAPSVADIVRPSVFGLHALSRASGALVLNQYYGDPLAHPPLALGAGA
ncbi:Sugar kinase of the NBD/HSP70 family, may contain an N-terminal HTH domain [Jiangella alkaliphila]|uniref:Sugar kinase of the NBD/HSP70 family, may contain an N-terminal HTH domain n=2 Tax=Jiangella alkaliphila TaxID=419479 RepID=A0A1H2KJ08_9ACTN|nr:Sugar kinase of the NBD/HSP70 family, may contain an N-terminal HTH domain [Jiangella alkaliphila]